MLNQAIRYNTHLSSSSDLQCSCRGDVLHTDEFGERALHTVMVEVWVWVLILELDLRKANAWVGVWVMEKESV